MSDGTANSTVTQAPNPFIRPCTVLVAAPTQFNFTHHSPKSSGPDDQQRNRANATLVSMGHAAVKTMLRRDNNTHCVISSMFGKQKTLWSISGGCMVKGRLTSRRKTRQANILCVTMLLLCDCVLATKRRDGVSVRL